MKTIFLLLISLFLVTCDRDTTVVDSAVKNSYVGAFVYRNFNDQIRFDIEQDTAEYRVFFTSLAQNANRIPLQVVTAKGDSLNFTLKSDLYTYIFKNKLSKDRSLLVGILAVDTVEASYHLNRWTETTNDLPQEEVVTLDSQGINLVGTIWHPVNRSTKAMVIVTSSGSSGRSATRAEALFFAQNGYTVFHYDKRGTGNSQGDWNIATMQDLLKDDINAIEYFSDRTNIPLSHIGIMGSSQGGAKIPYILSEMQQLGYGIAVSCPGSSLLESDLNYWQNNHKIALGDNLQQASELQRMVFEYIAGTTSKVRLESSINANKNASWFNAVWIPNLDEVVIDSKLLFNPLTYFEKVQQPILIVQGMSDEIIPLDSHRKIRDALDRAKNGNFELILLENTNHTMQFVGQSDFKYWSRRNPNYLNTLLDWANQNDIE
ncbi:MAG: prolyl oligopeptidase family serine peptidase [Gilvibacter sp.]